MVEKSKKLKKGSIGEEDVSILLQRYSVKTVLTLLQEVAKVAGEKIDWNAIVKNTSTGISSARECQMLWRHLAYGQTLTDQFENAANSMDDDSDLEYELEAFPAVSRETSMEAAACVKVLIGSDYPIDSHLPNSSTIEAPLTINIPKSRAFTVPSESSLLANDMQGTNICIPVSVQKQPLSSGTCGEKRPNNGTSGVNLPPRRKRRSWSTEDDVKLTAAVQKYGERNWANIARGDFKNDRTASELSQRWANLRKKQGNSNVGTSSQLSEAQVAAARRAMSLALGDNLKAARPMSTVGAISQHQSQKASISAPDQQLGITVPPKSQAPTKRPSTNPTPSPDSMVKAAAVAAGARIATSADASSLLQATSPNVVHIITGGSSVMKSSTSMTMTNQLPSNVHFIRNGLTKAPISAHSATLPSCQPGEAPQAQGNPIKPAGLAVQPTPPGSAPVLNLSSGVANTAASVPSIDVAVVSTSASADMATISDCAPIERVSEDISAATGKSTADLCTSKEIHENPGSNGRRENLPSTRLDGSDEAITSSTTATAGDGEN